MSDLDPEIWNNPTLGEAANLERLDVRTAQDAENRAAKLEGREPLEVRSIHPGVHDFNKVPLANSYDDGLRYYDAEGNEAPTNWGKVSPDGEPENPGYEKTDDVNGDSEASSTEFTGTEADSGANAGSGNDDGYQS